RGKAASLQNVRVPSLTSRGKGLETSVDANCAVRKYLRTVINPVMNNVASRGLWGGVFSVFR
ncbi:MAG: hypothetical protein K8S99_06220, partial [Planctomycetes bacterium]|nr:hypothetical protein [Planctomycetota bacterium]